MSKAAEARDGSLRRARITVIHALDDLAEVQDLALSDRGLVRDAKRALILAQSCLNCLLDEDSAVLAQQN